MQAVYIVEKVFTQEEIKRSQPDSNVPVGEYVRIPIWAIGRKVRIRNRILEPDEMRTALFESVIERGHARRYAYRIVNTERSIGDDNDYIRFQSPSFNNGNPCGVNADIKDDFIKEAVSRFSSAHPGGRVVVNEDECGITVDMPDLLAEQAGAKSML